MVNIRNEIKEAFEVRANEIGFCLDQHWGQYENPYINNDTALAYNLFKDGWTAANSIRDEELNGCVMVPVDQAKDTERLNFLLEDSPTRTICQHTHWSEDGELIAEGQCVAEIYYISGWDYIRESISETKRQAIDKAILEAARGGNE